MSKRQWGDGYHEGYRAAVTDLRENISDPADIEAWESAKDRAWGQYWKAVTIEDKAAALKIVIASHYHRSRYCWLMHGRIRHPDLTIYMQHWLLAQNYPGSPFDREVLLSLIGQYGRPKKHIGSLPRGCTYWELDSLYSWRGSSCPG